MWCRPAPPGLTKPLVPGQRVRSCAKAVESHERRGPGLDAVKVAGRMPELLPVLRTPVPVVRDGIQSLPCKPKESVLDRQFLARPLPLLCLCPPPLPPRCLILGGQLLMHTAQVLYRLDVQHAARVVSLKIALDCAHRATTSWNCLCHHNLVLDAAKPLLLRNLEGYHSYQGPVDQQVNHSSGRPASHRNDPMAPMGLCREV
mmetsp:Transcript_80730/g.223309  ORF Transcript_80730/g.223309 Transcript_80730/m.223309 type:complete len:202 (+) Transcript_80730:354-959(+)